MKIKSIIISCLILTSCTFNRYQNIYNADTILSQQKTNRIPPKEINQQKMQEVVNNLNKKFNINNHIVFVNP